MRAVLTSPESSYGSGGISCVLLTYWSDISINSPASAYTFTHQSDRPISRALGVTRHIHPDRHGKFLGYREDTGSQEGSNRKIEFVESK